MSRVKRVSFCLIALVISAIAVELIAYLGVRYGQNLEREQIEGQFRTVAQELEQSRARIRAHPLFTFVSYTPRSNNMGFESQYDYPYRKNPDEFVIGFLGGSVSQQLAGAAQSHLFEDGLKAKIPALRNKKIVVLSLGQPCGMQPMQYSIYSYFLDTLDLSVNIDGFNEVAFRVKSMPAAYPCNTVALYGDLLEKHRVLASIESTKNLRRKLVNLGIGPGPLSHSSVYYLLWKSVDVSLSRKLSDLDHELQLSGDPGIKLRIDRDDDADVVKEGVENWAKYSRLQSEIARAEHRRALFIIQPNLYDPEGKTLSQDEKRLIENGGFKNDARNVPRGYRLLREALADLRKHDKNFVDLSRLFQGHNETLYVDDCCHYNMKGHQLALEGITESIATALR